MHEALRRIEDKLDQMMRLQKLTLLLEGLTLVEIKTLESGNEAEQLKQIDQLRRSSDLLKAATIAASTRDASPEPVLSQPPIPSRKESSMANPVLDALTAQVKASTDAEASAVILINGIAARIQTAVDAAIAGGATAAELAPVQAEVDAMGMSSAALSAAVVANTPAAGLAPPKRKP